MSSTPRLVLASTSPARRALLSSLGVSYEVESTGVAEDVPQGTPVEEAVALLAERKARAVFSRRPDALIIGADQLVAFGGRALGKPEDRAAARAQLQALSGNTHDIITGLCVIGPSFFARETETTRMTLYRLTDEELSAYLDTNEWHGCAGGYRVEARGQLLFSAIDGDRTNVQGLPMVRLVSLLRRARHPLL